MLDVHAPDHRMSGPRDFLIHMLTITLGLLIALGLEAAVEAAHHRHQRREAEQTIREELRQNRSDILKTQTVVQQEAKNMAKVLDFLEARARNQPASSTGLNMGFSEGPLQDAAWRTAASTGVLSYMDYAQVQKFSSAYKETDQLERIQQQTLDEYLQLDAFIVRGFDPDHISPEDLKAAIPLVRQTLAHLTGTLDVCRGTLQTYEEALK